MSDLKYNFKTIEDVSVVESSDGGFLLLEKEGALRRILAKNLTAKSDITINGISPDENGNIEIKSDITINGISPDENGNIEIKVATEQVQADMAENDSTKASYIQNRLCYEVPSGEGKLVVGGPYLDIMGGEEENVPYLMGMHMIPEVAQVLEPNQTYLVRWMDKSYVCNTMDASVVGEDPDDGIVILGNVRKFLFFSLTMGGGLSEEEAELTLDELKLAKTEEPFFVISLPENDGVVLMVVSFDSNNEMPEIQIFEQNFDVKTLDEKFIPDSIARVSDLDWNNLNNRPFGDNTIAIEWDGNITDEMDVNKFPIFGEGTDEITKLCDLPAGLSKAEDLIGCLITAQGETLEVPEDIVEILSSVYHNIIPIGDPAIITFILDTTYSLHHPDEGTLEFTAPSPGVYVPGEARHATPVFFEKKTVKTLDEQFITDTIARVSDLDWNNLSNRPFYEEGTGAIIEWDETSANDELLIEESNSVQQTIFKISDLTPSIDELVGAVITVNAPSLGIDNQSMVLEEAMLIKGSTCVNALMLYVAYSAGTCELENGHIVSVPSPGTYGLIMEGYSAKLSYGSTTIKTIDEKFIPETIARVDQIPTIPPTSWNDLQDRPFYSEPMEPVDYENASINIPVGFENFGTLTNTPTFIKGAEYIVTLNQTDYRVEAMVVKGNNGEESLYLGNGSIFGEELGLPQTEEPFVILSGGSFAILANNGTENFTYIRIVNANDILYHKIDPAYLPTGSGSGSGLPEVSEKDNGKILMVKNGAWVITSLVNTEEVSY